MIQGCLESHIKTRTAEKRNNTRHHTIGRHDGHYYASSVEKEPTSGKKINKARSTKMWNAVFISVYYQSWYLTNFEWVYILDIRAIKEMWLLEIEWKKIVLAATYLCWVKKSVDDKTSSGEEWTRHACLMLPHTPTLVCWSPPHDKLTN